MQLTIVTTNDEIFNIEVSDDIELENVKALISYERGVPANEIQLVWDGQPLADAKKQMMAYGIGNGDILLLERIQSQEPEPAPTPVPEPEPEPVPVSLPLVPAHTPDVASLPQIDFGDIQMPVEAGTSSETSSSSQQDGQQSTNTDKSNDVAEQERLKEENRLKKVRANKEAALEYAPECWPCNHAVHRLRSGRPSSQGIH